MATKNSKDRIRKFGEVKTQNNEIKNMIGLVNEEIDRVDSRFLEPACGDGNFLYEILLKKLDKAYKLSKRDWIKFEVQEIYGLSSLYGIELLEDNVEKTRARLKNLLVNFFNDKFQSKLNNE